MSATFLSPFGAGSYNVIFDLAPFPMWIYDLENLSFLAVNTEAVRQYGYTQDEFLRMTLKDIRPKEEFPIFEKAIEEARTRKSLFKQSLFKHQRKDGTILHVQIKGNLIDFNGKPSEIVTAVDLTDRYEQERHIEENRLYLATIGTLNATLLKSSYWTDALQHCFEIIGEFLDVHHLYFFQTDKSNNISAPKISWLKQEKVVSKESVKSQTHLFCQLSFFLESLRKGEHFEAHISSLPSSPLKDSLTKQQVKSILGFPVIAKDVLIGFIRVDDCERKRIWQENDFQLLKSLASSLGSIILEAEIQEKLTANEARFRSLVQNGTDLIAIIDALGTYIYVSPSSLNVLGIPPEDFLGKNAFNFIYEDDVKRLKQSMGQILKKKSISIAPYRFQDANQNWRWIKTDLTNYLTDPAIKGIVANSRDVTAEVEKRMGEQLLVKLTKIICQPGSLASCLTKALDALISLSKINIAEIWLVSNDNSRVHLISKSCQNKEFEVFYQNSKPVDTLKKGASLAGHIWQVQKACRWDNLVSDKNLMQSNNPEKANIQTGLGIPIVYNEEFLGSLICFSTSNSSDLSDQAKLFFHIGRQIGPVVKQKVIEEEYRNFFNISPDPQCILGFDGYLKKFNKSFYKLLGYEQKELIGKPLISFLHPDEKEEYKLNFKATIRNTNPNSYEGRFLTKKGEIKWLIWNATVIPEGKIIIAAAKDISEQKMGEQKLKAAYSRLRTAQKIAKLGYWVRDLNSELSEWSEEAYTIYGYTPDTFTPTFQNVIQTFHPEDRHLIESDPLDKLVPGIIKSFENRILTASNEVKWVHQEIRLLSDHNNLPYRIEGTIQDITEQKEHELQLTQSNKKFQLAMKVSNEMIWEIDCIHKKVIRGQGYENKITYEQSEPFDKKNSWFQKIHAEDRDGVWQALQVALQDKDKQYWSMEYKVITTDGSLANFMDRCFILRDEKGLPLQCVGSALDVTVAKDQFEKIKEQNKKLREIAWMQSHVIRSPLARIMALINLSRSHKGGGKSGEEIFDMVAISAEELDKVIHEIIEKTDTLKENEGENNTHR